MKIIACTPECPPSANLPLPPAGAGIPVPPVKDFESHLLCDKLTGTRVIVVATFDGASSVPVNTYYNITGGIWAGLPSSLIECEDAAFESDSVPHCAAGVNVSQWAQKDANGRPTGVVWWTDTSGAVIVAPAPATLKQGACTIAVAPVFACIKDANGQIVDSIVIDYGSTPPIYWLAGTNTLRVLAPGETIADCGTNQQLVCVQTPHAAEINAVASLSAITGLAQVASFTVKGITSNWDISFDGGATYIAGVTGGSTWGDGNSAQVNTANIFIKPSVALQRVMVQWDTQVCTSVTILPAIPTTTSVTGIPVEEPYCVGGVQLTRRNVDGVISWHDAAGAVVLPTIASVALASAGSCGSGAAPVAANGVVSLINTAVAGNVAAGKHSVSITNVGTAAATVMGVVLPAGANITYDSHLNLVTNTWYLVPAIAYVASATANLLIATKDA